MVTIAESVKYEIVDKMEANRNILMEKLSGAFGEINHSVLAHKYRETTLVVKELMLKIVHRFQEKADNSEIVKYLKENAKYLIFHLTRKLSIVNPYIHKALENRLAIAYISLLLGFIGGRYWMQGYPQLQSQQMLSAVCGSYSGHESVALCRIPVPRLTSNYQVPSCILYIYVGILIFSHKSNSTFTNVR